MVSKDHTAPTAPTGLAVTVNQSQDLDFTWNPSVGAVSYDVYRAERADGPFSKVAETSSTSTGGRILYEDMTSQRGYTYWYRVTAVDAAANQSAPSTAVPGMRPSVNPAGRPQGLTATNDRHDGIALDWADNSEPDVREYRTDHFANTGTGFGLLATVPKGTSEYLDTAVNPGSGDYYYVTALNSSGTESGPSTVVEGFHPS
ncbi:fibronectin type III domain-containing protein [Streptomyces filipinensis]|uniref:fibronectin type III domain-containing protein n=1 Tax=Streptomyces filipinensis TaxID=66887 RepID=UPI0017804ABD|nr:hypothetical protein [Streptomyces filipinensis]